MTDQQGSSLWAEANGGMRGSLLLRWGSVGYVLSAILNVVVAAVSTTALGPGNPVFLTALSFWVVTLLLIGSGFLWTGIHPFMTRFGLVVGLYTFTQAGYILISLVKPEVLAVPPSILTMERTFLMGLFALLERKYIGQKAAWVLGLGSVFQLVRITLRTVGPYPDTSPMAEHLLSTALMSLTAIGIFLVAKAVSMQEELWALENQPQRIAHFVDFNNPQHQWNKVKEKEEV